MKNVDYLSEALDIVPITQYQFNDLGILYLSLNHGFGDIGHIFPTWKVFLDRSEGKVQGIENYMAYVLCRHINGEIIGVLAVQLTDYDSLKLKVQAIIPDINTYLYLSWIALDVKYQKINYFALLFEFYHALIRRFRKKLNTSIEGAAVAIRRMRPVLWNLLNSEESCPTSTDTQIIKESPRVNFLIKPGETIDPNLTPKHDHLLIMFNAPI